MVTPSLPETRMLAAALFLTLAATQAQAVAQFTSTSMSCQALKSAVSMAGAGIVRYQSQRIPGLPRYDRYVRNSQFCSGNDITIFDYVPTRDVSQCALRKCIPYDGQRNLSR